MGILPVCMSVHHLNVWCLIRPEEGFRSLEQELQTAVKHHVEQPVFLTAVPSSQPMLTTFYAVNYCV